MIRINDRLLYFYSQCPVLYNIEREAFDWSKPGASLDPYECAACHYYYGYMKQMPPTHRKLREIISGEMYKRGELKEDNIFSLDGNKTSITFNKKSVSSMVAETADRIVSNSIFKKEIIKEANRVCDMEFGKNIYNKVLPAVSDKNIYVLDFSVEGSFPYDFHDNHEMYIKVLSAAYVNKVLNYDRSNIVVFNPVAAKAGGRSAIYRVSDPALYADLFINMLKPVVSDVIYPNYNHCNNCTKLGVCKYGKKKSTRQ